ncbi:hypothetical protein HGA10_24850 [Nocardia coubleae]|uniref:Colicin D immunity protein domain-containing protein n=2 Tax=Nocardia coubleae TaxID=356147 RepID=A0A846WDA3_9NOCA|nr:hypothetical protein [Nocardia coubleae]
MVAGYRELIRSFAKGEKSADQFEQEYLQKFKHDENQILSPEFDILDSLFADVDEYVADPELREDAGGLDADRLRSRAQAVFRKLYSDSTD